MLITIEAIIDINGNISLLEKYYPNKAHKALVTILDDELIDENSLLSEPALAVDWNKHEEDESWTHLQ